MESQHEAVQEAFQHILINWPLGHKTSFFSKPIFQTHVGVSLQGPSRSEPLKTHFCLTVPKAALIPLFWPPAPSFAAPGVAQNLMKLLPNHIMVSWKLYYKLISDIIVNDCKTKKILKFQYIFKNFILFYIQSISLPPNFQYKKWTSARVRRHTNTRPRPETSYEPAHSDI